ncbi:MAG: HEAT repeat domain-containing protein [Deltaproteobacteria bacterium]|nr:HEAT repeat domain-containing protein [Deltaproteobacteria bacterium]
MDIQTSLDKLRSGSEQEKQAAIEFLRAIDLAGIIECLVERVEATSSVAEKEKVFNLLKKFAFPVAGFSFVERMFRSDEPFLRNAAIESMHLFVASFLSTMSTLVEDPNKDVRKFVVDTLADSSLKEWMAIVEGRLADPNANVQQAAIEALGNMGINSPASAIEEVLLKENKLMIRCTCLEALAKLGHSPNRRVIIQELIKESHPLIMFSFFRYLGALGGKEELDLLETLLEQQGSILLKPVVEAAAAILDRHQGVFLPPALCQKLHQHLMENPESDLAWEMARTVLFGMGDSALDQAREMVKSDYESFRMAAAEYLDQFGTEDDAGLIAELA